MSKYSEEFKLKVVNYYLNNHYGWEYVASVVSKWERIYYEEGPQALYKEQRGRNKTMCSKPRKKKLSKENEEDLIEEMQRLRMENAYLKKL